MIQQIELRLPAMRRGCHLITGEIARRLAGILPETGLLNIFVKHTSCGLTINENADPDVRTDMAEILDRLVPENEPYYEHTLEGADDMPAHAKSTLTGASLTVPIARGRLNLGTWQGIYLCEFRDYGGERTLVLTVYS
ncbi:MAG: secondary thiamine-phosphate synthase enzyme YjbQ [Muribaculaceae bacterium]|nr:secondary thiamine-phosphate synthase enzyme YjbQ [Muribaculaceae bacterium]